MTPAAHARAPMSPATHTRAPMSPSARAPTPGLFTCLKEGQMDFVGQHKAQQIFTFFIWLAAAIGFVYGLVTQRFLNTFLILCGSLVLSAVVCIPGWPIFNRHRIQFKKCSVPDKKD